MVFYLGVGLFLWAVAIRGVLAREQTGISLLASALVFWFVCAFRFETGFDWIVYERYFEAVSSSGFMEFPEDVVSMEPLFYLLNYLVSYVGGFQLFLFVVGTFNTFCALRFLLKFKIRASFGLAFCFCWVFLPLELGTIRQSLAVSFVLLAMCEFSEKKSIKAGLLFLIAVGFQYSAIMYAVIFLSKLVRFIIRNAWLFLAVCLGVYASGYGAGQTALMIGTSANIPFVSEKLAIYSNFGFSQRTIPGAVFLIFNCVVLLMARHYIRDIGRKEVVVFGSLIFLIAAQSLIFDFALIWNRIQYLACFSQAVIIYWIIWNMTIVKRIAFAGSVILASLASLFFFVSSPNLITFIPYRSYIEYILTDEAGDGRARSMEYYRQFDENLER